MSCRWVLPAMFCRSIINRNCIRIVSNRLKTHLSSYSNHTSTPSHSLSFQQRCCTSSETNTAGQNAKRTAEQDAFYEQWLAFRRTEMRAGRVDMFCYAASFGLAMLGLSWLMVPLWRKFCEATGAGGKAAKRVEEMDKIEHMKKIENRILRIKFLSDVGSSLTWQFKPLQSELLVHPGETALAFYTAYNQTDKPVVGISTYNILPFQAALYFMKIQCFCFEEQILNPGEQVDMPVFFYIDPDFVEDPATEYCDEITLSYTFFESKAGMDITNTLATLKDTASTPNAS